MIRAGGARDLFLSGLCLAVVNVGVKALTRIPPTEILLFRAVVSLGLTAWAIRLAGLDWRGRNRRMLVLRGLLGTFGLLMYFHSLQNMPFASAVTVQYLHPLLTGFAAAVWLREQPTVPQWALLATSFVGVLLIKGFDGAVPTGELLIGLGGALLTAVSFTVIRALRRDDHPLVVMLYLPMVSLVVLGPWVVVHGVKPVGAEWGWLTLVGVFTQLGQFYLTRAYQREAAGRIANLNYLNILYALLVGVFFFGERVSGGALAGALLIAVSATFSWRASK